MRPFAVLGESVGIVPAKLRGDVSEGDTVLGPARASKARLDVAEIEREHLVKLGIGVGVGPEEALLLGVGLGEGDDLGGTPGELQVPNRFVVDREHSAGGAVLRGHVGDRRAVGEREAREAWPEELHELADDTLRAQHFGHCQDEVGCGRSSRKATRETHPDDDRSRLRECLAKEHGLGLDATDAEADNAKPVDHGRVGVGADECVGEGGQLAIEFTRLNQWGQVLEVDLVDDSGARWDGPEVVKGLLGPAQELIALAVSLVLAGDVCAVGLG